MPALELENSPVDGWFTEEISVMLKRLEKEDLPLNKPLPWTLVDQHGYLLMQQGQLIVMPEHLDALVARGVFIMVADEADQGGTSGQDVAMTAAERALANMPLGGGMPVFTRATQQVQKLGDIFEDAVFNPSKSGTFERDVKNLAQQLIRAVEHDADSLLAAVHLDRQSPYRIAHQYLGAMLVAGLAPFLGFSSDDCVVLVSAALTRDLGLIELDRDLALSGMLTVEQRQAIRLHPLRSADILRANGIENEVWLNMVMHHHERLDGSGYPARHSGDKLSPEMRLLGLVDSYAAQVIHSPRHRPNFPANALRELYLAGHSHQHYDPKQISLMVKYLTRYPPGSLFRFGKGEIAVVRNRSQGDSQSLDAWVLYDELGMPLLTPRLVTLDAPDEQIRAMVAIEDCRSAESTLKRLWGQKKPFAMSV